MATTLHDLGTPNGPLISDKELLEKTATSEQIRALTPPDSHQPIGIKINDLSVQGFVSPVTGVANFLNIPFARIPGRFREATLIDPREEKGIIDATTFGPICPQNVDIPHQTTKHLYPQILGAAEVENAGEYTCLNLNIYAPPDAVSSGEGEEGKERDELPVLVWIHGGAFHYGANTEEYDGNYIVQHSIRIGKPIIVVSLNYRLGYYGFFSSKELKEEARRLGETGYANLALHDQRLGLQWIQRNIHHFAGSPTSLTCAGESAGACSILMHLRSSFPAFQRAFILSPADVKFSDADAAQATFDELVSRIGVPASAPARQKLDAIRDLTVAELNRLTPRGVVYPVWDEEWFSSAKDGEEDEEGNWNTKPLPPWIQQIVIGSAKEETVLFGAHWASWTGAQATAAVKATLGDTELAGKVLATYGIKDDDQPGSALESLVGLTTDAFFRRVVHDVASAARSNPSLPVSLYSFEQRDSFPQSPAHMRGRAYHSLGNSMFFRQPTVARPGAAVDAGTWKTSDKMCEAAVSLAHGEQPWEPYAANHKVMVFDGERTGLKEAPGRMPWENLPRGRRNQELLRDLVTAVIRL